MYLIRHARPAIAGVMLGQLDPPLESLDHAPLSLDVAAVFASPLKRSLQTAACLFPGRCPQVLPGLREIRLGEWDGKSWADIEAGWPQIARAKLEDWRGVTPPGGELWSDFEGRVEEAWRVIRNCAGPCAVVAHAAVNSVLYRLATGGEQQRQQAYNEVVSLEIL